MMLGGKKDGGASLASNIYSKYMKRVPNEENISPRAKIGEEHEDDEAAMHRDGMHEAMHNFHEAFHGGDIHGMAKAFAAGHVLAKKYMEHEQETDSEKQDDRNIELGVSPFEKG
jgi:DNA-directed RNA polymerase subunit N (RpoN/RPB10)